MAALFHIPKVAGVTKATAKQQMLKQLICSDAAEQALRYHGYTLIAGVDEVGRGALFGPPPPGERYWRTAALVFGIPL